MIWRSPAAWRRRKAPRSWPRAPYVDIVLGPQTYHRLPEMVAQRAAAPRRAVIDTDFPADRNSTICRMRRRRRGVVRVPVDPGRLRQILLLLRGALYARRRGEPACGIGRTPCPSTKPQLMDTTETPGWPAAVATPAIKLARLGLLQSKITIWARGPEHGPIPRPGPPPFPSCPCRFPPDLLRATAPFVPPD